MASKTNGSIKRPEMPNHVREEGPNWIIILGGALLSTLSIKLCCKLKQVFHQKRPTRTRVLPRENGKSTTDDRHEPCKSHSKFCCCALDEDGCYRCFSGSKHVTASPMYKVGNSLPLIKVPSVHSSTDNGEFLWAPITDRLELPLKPFNYPNSSDSPCISESGSDIHSKREVLKKLRLQLRSRDDMIMEMQDQITDLQRSMTIQMAHTTNLQNQLSSSNEFLSNSEREIHRLQKSIADRFVCESGSPENTRLIKGSPPEVANGHAKGNGCPDGVNQCVAVEKHGGDGDGIEMLRKEAKELHVAIERKERLILCYEKQKVELSSKLKELQLRLLPNIM